MRTENIAAYGQVPLDVGKDREIDGFLAKATDGVGIEELMAQDTFLQRRAGKALLEFQREQRRRLVEEAVKKMKQAADSRFWSSALGAAFEVGAKLIECFGAKPLENLLGSKEWSKLVCGAASAVASGVSKFNHFDADALKKDAEAKLLEGAAQAKGEAARDTGDWLGTARELERRMLDRMDQLAQGEHQSRMEVMRRIGD